MVRTSIIYFNLAINELISAKYLSKPRPLMSWVLTRLAERKAIIVISFLTVIVGPNLVYPQCNIVIHLILQRKS